MEPLGATASIVQLCDVCAKLLKYLHEMHEGPKERIRLLTQVTSTQTTVQIILQMVEAAKSETWSAAITSLTSGNNGGPVGILTTTLVGMHEELLKLTSKVGVQKLGSHIVWPIKKSSFEARLAIIARHQALLSMALSHDHIRLSKEIQDATNVIEANTEAIVDDTTAIRSDTTSILDHTVAIRDSTKAVHDDTTSMLENIKLFAKRADSWKLQKDEAKARAILAWLTDTDHSKYQNGHFARRQQGTGEWFLTSEEYQTWLKTRGGTLFCPGIPGSGKTIMSSMIIRDLILKYGSDASVGIAYIYINFNRPQEQTVVNLLLSLAKQLAERLDDLPPELEKLYDKHIEFKSRPDEEESRKLLESIILVYDRVFVVLDALDECQVINGCRNNMMDDLFQIREISGLNILATSRPTVSKIVEKFRSVENSGTLEIRAQDEDVLRYLDGRISADRGARLLQTHSEEIKAEITNVVSGMFLLAQLHFDSIRSKPTWKKMKAALKSLPTGRKAYDDAYDEAMNVRLKSQDPEVQEIAMQALMWIVCAKRELTTEELRYGLAVELDEVEFDEENLLDIQQIVTACVGLVTVDEESSVIRLVHYTTQEYFDRPGNRQFWFPDADTHLSEICTTYLALDVFAGGGCNGLLREGDFELGEVDIEASQRERMGERFEQRLIDYPFFSYASRNWYHHTRDSHELRESVINFLECEGQVEAASQGLMYTHHWRNTRNLPWERTTGLHLAACCGVEIAVRALLNRGSIAASTLDRYGRTALMYAVASGHLAIVKMLLEAGVDPELKDEVDANCLHVAALCGHTAVVKHLLEVAEFPHDEEEWTTFPCAATVAAVQENEAVFKLLIDSGRTPNLRQNIRQVWEEYLPCTPMLLIALDRRSRESSDELSAIPKMLVDYGADLEERCGDELPSPGFRKANELTIDWYLDSEYCGAATGGTALHITIESECCDLARFLLANGADVNSRNGPLGLTPLHVCCMAHGYFNASHQHPTAWVKLLVENGADMDAMDARGNTALQRVLQMPGLLDLDPSECFGKFETLLEHGANANQVDHNGRTPLHIAMSSGVHDGFSLSYARVLCIAGTEADRLDNRGRTPLSYAVERGKELCARYLIKKQKAQPNMPDYLSRTPLFYASRSADESAAIVLLEGGKACVHARDFYGATALTVAAKFGRNKLVRRLLQCEGIELDCIDHFGKTPLCWAIVKGQVDTVEILLDEYSSRGIVIPLEGPVGIWPTAEEPAGVTISFQRVFHRKDREVCEYPAPFCDACMCPFTGDPCRCCFYYCSICLSGTFKLCTDCFRAGIGCMSKSHYLEQHNGPIYTRDVANLLELQFWHDYRREAAVDWDRHFRVRDPRTGRFGKPPLFLG